MPVINPMFAIRRILCPVDFSEPSARALEYALALAERLGAEVDVVHVFQFPTFAVEDLALPLYLQENLSQRLRERLEQLLIEKAGEGPKATARVLEGVPYVEIMEADARRARPDALMERDRPALATVPFTESDGITRSRSRSCASACRVRRPGSTPLRRAAPRPTSRCSITSSGARNP